MHKGALLVGLLSLLGCGNGPGARRSSRDGGTVDGVGVDAFSGAPRSHSRPPASSERPPESVATVN
jgi:hypothetical protein